eukprot:TRINITY_DN11962_c0_g2_i1.p1 TRINITY_DN11962_c0_g2~~TRINITY_DN11962_c0_g2_i1.p1  ORF type:complete len:642 (-),score=126.02 TRINITY_DN11962_c0_g2_i1:144-2069(-)
MADRPHKHPKFADDNETVVVEATTSATSTHKHPTLDEDGDAGEFKGTISTTSVRKPSSLTSSEANGEDTQQGSPESRISAFSSNMSMATTSLTDHLPPEMMRGVALSEVMSSCGKHFADAHAAPDDFRLSAPVEKLDAFLSHDWCTPRWKKHLALCMIYNTGAAAAMSVLVGAVLGVLQMRSVGVLPVDSSKPAVVFEVYVGYWSAALSPVVFVATLFLWQGLRSWLPCVRLRVFLDRLCIHQTNMDMKMKGVYGLAAFLHKAEHIVVLWTPRYFTRLWCAYELASWFTLKSDPDSKTIFFPVVSSFIRVALFLQSVTVVASSYMNSGNFLIDYAVMLALCTSTFVCHMCVLRRECKELLKMNSQLATFHIKASECYCCSVEHESPFSDEPLICDRRLVYLQLKRWWHQEGKPASDECETPGQEHLYHFDRKIREHIKHSLKGSVGISYIEAASIGTPFLWKFADIFFSAYEKDAELALHGLVEYSSMCFLVTPLLVQLQYSLFTQLETFLLGKKLPYLKKAVCRQVCAAVFLVIAMFITLPQRVAFLSQSWEAQACIVALQGLMLIATYWPERLSLFRKKAAQPVKDEVPSKDAEGLPEKSTAKSKATESTPYEEGGEEGNNTDCKVVSASESGAMIMPI